MSLREELAEYNLDNICRLIFDIYEIGGPYEVMRFVQGKFPDWVWEECYYCEEDTPTWADVCCVCWTQREWASV